MITIEQARAYYADGDPVHDFAHVLRVLALAERLARAERADLKIVRTAALLHDIARDPNEGMGLKAEADIDHAIRAAQRARRLLAGADPAFVGAVAHAIEAHRFRNDVEPATIEAKVLFDADKLDAIGAVGIARAFAYGAMLGQPLWGEVAPDYVPGEGGGRHTPHHEFHTKLKHIKERLYTESGRHLAEERHRFMVAFFEEMSAEVQGKR